MTKGMAAMLVYTTKECNYNSIVIVHQHDGYDVTCKPRILSFLRLNSAIKKNPDASSDIILKLESITRSVYLTYDCVLGL